MVLWPTDWTGIDPKRRSKIQIHSPAPSCHKTIPIKSSKQLMSHPSSPIQGIARSQPDEAGLSLLFHIKTIELELLCPHRSEMTGK